MTFFLINYNECFLETDFQETFYFDHRALYLLPNPFSCAFYFFTFFYIFFIFEHCEKPSQTILLTLAWCFLKSITTFLYYSTNWIGFQLIDTTALQNILLALLLQTLLNLFAKKNWKKQLAIYIFITFLTLYFFLDQFYFETSFFSNSQNDIDFLIFLTIISSSFYFIDFSLSKRALAAGHKKNSIFRLASLELCSFGLTFFFHHIETHACHLNFLYPIFWRQLLTAYGILLHIVFLTVFQTPNHLQWKFWIWPIVFKPVKLPILFNTEKKNSMSE